MKLFNYGKQICGITYPSHPLLYFIGALVQIGNGVVTALTLGLCDPGWHATFTGWIIQQRCKNA